MQPRLLKLVDAIRSSYWFLPTVMAILALVLGFGVIYIDAKVGSDWLDSLSWYQANKPEGAQEVLSTIAGSAITVAGVVFSITIVSISFAASQYGPRVLTTFMSDSGNQVTLGTFIATYLYCLVVLRTVRGGDSGFVPDLAIIVALILALCSIGVLIFFIHHVPRSIHVNTVLSGIGHQLIASLKDSYPRFIGERPPETASEAPFPDAMPLAALTDTDDPVPIRARATGYIEVIDDAELMAVACTEDLMVRVRKRPGDYIRQGETFALVWPRDRLSDRGCRRLESTIAVGDRRTPVQDTRFLVDELVEVGVRALSPGVNDPFTAVTCLDWLGAALCEVAARELPSAVRADTEGRARVIADPLTFEIFVQRAFGQFRQYLATDRNTFLHALATIDTVSQACSRRMQIRALLDEAEALVLAARDGLDPALFDSTRTEVISTRDKTARRLADLD